MDRIRHKFDVRVTASATSVVTEGFFKSKPLQQQAQIVNRSMVCRFHMACTFLDVTVVSKKTEDCEFLFRKRGQMERLL